MHALLDRLATRRVPVQDAEIFRNVNTPADYAGLGRKR